MILNSSIRFSGGSPGAKRGEGTLIGKGWGSILVASVKSLTNGVKKFAKLKIEK